jgi:hypothetical protein
MVYMGRTPGCFALTVDGVNIDWGLSFLVGGASLDDGLVAMVAAVQPFLEYIIPTYRSAVPIYRFGGTWKSHTEEEQ